MAISKDKLDQFKTILLEKKERIQGNIKILGGDVDFGDSPGRDNEEADEGEAAANRLANIISLKESIANIDVSLTKMDLGTYGVCAKCGEEIELELLEVNPESTSCKECKD
ncbi:MAG: TraR/DksA C4-type zinc finger protein [Candidatus Colwellbacteria bacterium]|nr:TraR/DksA C4-type zinc finger protein [Candidatus Colwellbacteria bacterium]